MKRVVATLVALAMILIMAPAAFAVTESGYLMIAAGGSQEWTATASGTVSLTSESGYNIAVLEGDNYLTLGPSPIFDAVEGTTYTIQHFGSGFDMIYWELSAAGGNAGGPALEGNQIAIESYGYGEFTATQNGTVKFTLDVDASMDIIVDYSPVALGLANGATLDVTAGTTYSIYPAYGTPDCILTWEYVDGGNGGGNGGAAESIPSGSALALGDNNVSLTYATMPMMAPYWTYTATESGYLTVTVSSINGNAMLDMAFGRGMYTLLVGETDGQFTNMATVYLNANDTVNIAVLDTMDMEAVPAVINLGFVAGEPVVERNPADYFDRDPDGNYIIGSLESPVNIFVGNDDINYIYTVEFDGVLSVEPSDPTMGGNIWYIVNGVNHYSIAPDSVSAGDVVILNIWGGFEGTATLTAGGGNGGGGASEAIPSGSALALGDNNVSLTYATMPMMAPYWTYTATESGYLTVTVSSINGNAMLDMAFGRGMYTLLVGETDGQFTNMATVYLNANDTVNIAVLDTMDMEAVPAVINLGFVAGEPVVERNPADYFDRDPDGNYIIGSLESPVNIFVGNDDINYIYTVEFDGVLSVEPSDPTMGGNIWYIVNGVNHYSIAPDSVSAGDVVILNIWGGFEGTATLTAGGGGGNESAPMIGENVAVGEDETLEITYTPDIDGTLTIDISANPGYRVEVQNVATMDTVGLPKESGLAQELTYELEAGVTYKIILNGFSTAAWTSADATITYEITFAAGVSSEPVEMDKSDVVLELGANTVDLLENTIVSLYEFIPAEPGIYTITVSDGVTAATYGFSAWNLIAEANNGLITHTATAAEQSILIGLCADTASVTVTVEKTGNYTPPAQIEYDEYEPSCPVVSDFEDPTNLVNIDVNKEQNVVLGSDGYYHLGTADGPIVYVNLNNEQFTLALLYDAGAPITMRGTYTDEEGNEFHYDFMAMINGNYYSYSQGNDYHPLNKDLMVFLKAYGKAQGWYSVNTSSFAAIANGEFLEESAWLVSCYSTVASVDAANQGGNTGNAGDNTDSVPKTGDAGIMGAVIAMVISVFGGAAVIVKKKEF